MGAAVCVPIDGDIAILEVARRKPAVITGFSSFRLPGLPRAIIGKAASVRVFLISRHLSGSFSCRAPFFRVPAAHFSRRSDSAFANETGRSYVLLYVGHPGRGAVDA